jgi:hypothetical protein
LIDKLNELTLHIKKVVKKENIKLIPNPKKSKDEEDD